MTTKTPNRKTAEDHFHLAKRIQTEKENEIDDWRFVLDAACNNVKFARLQSGDYTTKYQVPFPHDVDSNLKFQLEFQHKAERLLHCSIKRRDAAAKKYERADRRLDDRTDLETMLVSKGANEVLARAHATENEDKENKKEKRPLQYFPKELARKIAEKNNRRNIWKKP